VGAGIIVFTNMDNIHTCIVHDPNLVIAIVWLVHGKRLKFPGNMICGARVEVPIGIDSSRCGGHARHAVVRHEILIVHVPTISCGVPDFHANLAPRARLAAIESRARGAPGVDVVVNTTGARSCRAMPRSVAATTATTY
jgi:hypothetical protein